MRRRGLATRPRFWLTLATLAATTGSPGTVRAASPPTEGSATGARPLTSALPPWSRAQLPDWASSVHVLKDDQPLRVAPSRDADRRGSVARAVHLPLYGATSGRGCGLPWLHVGPRAWVCGDDVKISAGAPIAAGRLFPDDSADGLPYRYFFAGPDGSLAYARLEQVDIGEPVMSLERGFAVAIVEERRLSGQRYGRTNRDLWVPLRDFGPARRFFFRGAELEDVTSGSPLPVAWVVSNVAPEYRRTRTGFAVTSTTRKKFDQVAFHERHRHFSGGFIRTGRDRWIRARDLRHHVVAPPPSEVDVVHEERWIDIELETQTLVAYEGARPVFATMVSTGKGRTRGHPFETPKGVHRIWVKLLSTTMDNLENDRAHRYWRIEDVPYVQFFKRGVGLHGAFWHRGFGRVRSHGCVNLAPLDARRLFWWTQPIVPAGWTASLPTPYDRGTIVRVR
ncbi:MAG: L,D-transpeptidase [Myxococcota bacterium]